MFDNIFGKCGQIFKIILPIREKILYVYTQRLPPHHNILLHYLVKVKNPNMLLILPASSTNCWHVPEDTLYTWFNIWQ